MGSFRRDHVASLPDKRNAFSFNEIMKSLEPTGDDTAITAKAGGGQSTATPLKANIFVHEVTTVATAADSIALPAAVEGAMHFVKNSAANAMQVFCSGTDTIDSVATGTGISQGAGEGELYYCAVPGNYVRLRGVGTSETFTDITLTGLLYESAANAVTAFAGGGQASATALTKELNRVSTVASAADSVKLPASVAGLTILVENAAANPMQVFGAGTDTINGVATGTGVSQMPGSVVIYSCYAAGAWFTEGLATGFSGGLQTLAFTNGITAFATGGQASATALTSMINRVTVCATAADSVKLPASAPGMELVVINKGAAALAVFPATGDLINGQAANASVTQQVNSVVVYVCTVAGTWETAGIGTGFSGSFQTTSFTNAITAFSTGGQASAVALTTGLNRITVCAAAGDSVKLPTSVAGMTVTVSNASTTGKGADVFPATGDAINNLSANLALRLPPGSTITFVCDVAGTWNATVPQPDAKYTTRALSSSTANAGDLTGAKWVTLNNSGATPGNLTTRTGAQMIADGFYQVGDSYNLRIVNGQGTGTLTLVAGDGNVTLTGTMTMAINTFRDFVVTVTGAATLTIQNVGTGSFS